jgi:hypothetical protein
MKKKMFSLRKLPFDCEVRGHCMCKAIQVNREEDKKRITRKNGGPRRWRGTRVAAPPQKKTYICKNKKKLTSVKNLHL